MTCRIRRRLLAATPALLLAFRPALAQTASADYTPARDDVRAFVASLVARHGFDESRLIGLLAQARTSQTALRLIQPGPPGRRSWSAYRGRFVEPRRIREGIQFWEEHADALQQASQRWGVPEEIIVAIIGVETFYGRQTGDFRVIDALATLGFDYAPRSDYFRGELEQFLLLAREGRVDALETRGSYAGAIGLPQFMPTSIRNWGVDFDSDGRIDLRHSPTDAIGSVARFLAEHGWRSGATTHYPVAMAEDARIAPALEAGIPPKLTMLELMRLGISSPAEIPASEKLALIDLPDPDAPTSYVLGAHNFYVVTRYNRSYFYAMAVIELAQMIRIVSMRVAR